jgi:hypothetical protein
MRVFVGTMAAIGAAVGVFAFARSRGASSLFSLAHGETPAWEKLMNSVCYHPPFRRPPCWTMSAFWMSSFQRPLRYIAPPPPKTMTREWQEAATERSREEKINPISGE